MAKIENKGKPTKQTKADVNDIYVDLDTGLSYRCVIIVHVGFDTEYWWEPDDVDYTFTNTQTLEEAIKEIPEPAPEVPTRPSTQQRNYSNYSKQSRKNKR